MHYLPHLCTYSILYRWYMTLPFAMGKQPYAPYLHAVTSVVRVFPSHAFLLQGTNELMRYVSLWENMTNQGSEYIERNVHKHKVQLWGNSLLVQKSDPLSQLCNTCWVWGFFSSVLISATFYTARKDLLRSNQRFLKKLNTIKQPGRKKATLRTFFGSDQRSKPKRRHMLNKQSELSFYMKNYICPFWSSG